ncbi:hypothetical protein [Neptuniibacter sp. QD37_11]|uniref:hypothetical protein n=1 Tax=Neptuniibacter sp. QD37_11 TaxID=3398209 RepID=UPI0039F4AC53
MTTATLREYVRQRVMLTCKALRKALKSAPDSLALRDEQNQKDRWKRKGEAVMADLYVSEGGYDLYLMFDHHVEQKELSKWVEETDKAISQEIGCKVSWSGDTRECVVVRIELNREDAEAA